MIELIERIKDRLDAPFYATPGPDQGQITVHVRPLRRYGDKKNSQELFFGFPLPDVILDGIRYRNKDILVYGSGPRTSFLYQETGSLPEQRIPTVTMELRRNLPSHPPREYQRQPLFVRHQ